MSFNVSIARLPEELQSQVKYYWSLNTSGISGSNEGPDFKLEAINKTLQHWLPSSPSGHDWQQVSCQYDDLLHLRETVFDQIGTQDPKIRERGKPRDLSEEVKAFRQLIRSKDYLSNPKIDRHLISLDNEMLNQDLVNFSARSREKHALYFDAYMNHEEKRTVVRTTIPFKQDPVFVTMTETETHEALENKTIEMIKSEIEYMLSHLSDENIKEAFT